MSCLSYKEETSPLGKEGPCWLTLGQSTANEVGVLNPAKSMGLQSPTCHRWPEVHASQRLVWIVLSVLRGGVSTWLPDALLTEASWMARPRVILWIDDDVLALEARKELLECSGYSALTAASGQEGLGVFAWHRIDAVILDYQMPEMTGDRVASEMKRIKPDIPPEPAPNGNTCPLVADRFENWTVALPLQPLSTGRLPQVMKVGWSAGGPRPS